MRTPIHLRRAGVAVAGAALLLAGAAGANAAGRARSPAPVSTARPSPPPPSLPPPWHPAPSWQFVGVDPCRILDTRMAGRRPARHAHLRRVAEQLHRPGREGRHLQHPGRRHGGAAQPRRHLAVPEHQRRQGLGHSATHEPLASLVNYNPSGPVANMVTHAGGRAAASSTSRRPAPRTSSPTSPATSSSRSTPSIDGTDGANANVLDNVQAGLVERDPHLRSASTS